MRQKTKLLRRLKQLELDQRLNRLQFKKNNPIGLNIFKKRIMLSQRYNDLNKGEKHGK